MIDTASEREEPLECVGDVSLDLLWWHAVIESCHQHDGNVDWGEHVHGHLSQAGNAQHANEKTNDDDEIWMTDRECWHLGSTPYLGRRRAGARPIGLL